MEEIKGFRKSFVIISVFYVIAGIVLLFWPAMSIALFCRALGIGMLVIGLTHIVIYFTKDHMMNIMQMDLVIGVVCVAFGAFLLLHPDFVEIALPFAMGILLLIGAITKLQNAIDLKRLMVKHWYIVLVFAVILMILGAILIYNPFSGQVLLIYIGVSLILDGLLNIISMLCIAVRLKKKIRQQGEKDGDARQIVDMPESPKTEKQELEIKK
ncbi:MAG: DUF308 domain-containing protein [Lachnospiraceae bacterium]|nr:DUF308 domain-containing protein [Lachnospiraceae bacterium]MDD3795131.1 DUF308 domain-containing protein [Lachnospiraceae bacterium]